MFQEVLDTAIILGMFFVRIGVPIVVTIGIGVWLEKKLRPAEFQKTSQRVQRGKIIPFPRVQNGARVTAAQRAHCWEAKQCDPAKRAQCPAYQRPDLPCWLALQAAGGRVRPQCADCEFYTQPRRAVV
jgi:hypothetical protein